MMRIPLRPPRFLLLASALLGGATACAGDDSQPIAANLSPCPFPGTETALPDGGVALELQSGPRLMANVVIGGATVKVLLDTGSAGLRVLASALDGGIEPTDAAVSYAYHDNNLVLNGFAATAPVTIGDRTTPSISFMVITAACRYPHGELCDADSGTPATNIFDGDGVLGVSMQINPQDNGIDSPFAQFADQPAFIVHLGSSTTDPSRIVFGQPDALDVGFSTILLPVYDAGAHALFPSWVNRGIPSLVRDDSSGVSFALPASIDTGNPSPYIEWPTPTASPTAGDSITVAVGTGASCAVGSYSFTVGTAPETFHVEMSSSGFMNLGIEPLYHYDTLFDPWHGIVGVRPR